MIPYDKGSHWTNTDRINIITSSKLCFHIQRMFYPDMWNSIRTNRWVLKVANHGHVVYSLRPHLFFILYCGHLKGPLFFNLLEFR